MLSCPQASPPISYFVALRTTSSKGWLFGLLEEFRPRWEYNRPTGPEVTSLNAAGRATALAHLHTLATGTRVDLRA